VNLPDGERKREADAARLPSAERPPAAPGGAHAHPL